MRHIYGNSLASKTYDITPVPKPRMTRSDAWKKRPTVMRYWAFKNQVKMHGISFENGNGVIFVMPMPESWSKKKKAEFDGKPHIQTPDFDNLFKSLCDCIYENDSHIWHISESKKIWGYEGKIIVTCNAPS